MSRLSCSHNSLKSILKKQEGEDLGQETPRDPPLYLEGITQLSSLLQEPYLRMEV